MKEKIKWNLCILSVINVGFCKITFSHIFIYDFLSFGAKLKTFASNKTKDLDNKLENALLKFF